MKRSVWGASVNFNFWENGFDDEGCEFCSGHSLVWVISAICKAFEDALGSEIFGGGEILVIWGDVCE